eukprot:TRINITY_DN8830_c0_g1_i1.p1 TRINITY_DN8830_c0_g1~~TRINITY_DN8830_c0_g1_i1.p1  ORF type:complete len:202 (+),score=17.75 TRINITY_DN8830_c0_g1_i1:116-721(+)
METKFDYRDAEKPPPTPDYKFCLLGEVGVGKTSFACTIGLGEFPKEYVPTVFDMFTVPIELPKSKQTKHVNMWELPIGCFDERTRALSYPMTDCSLFAFSVDKRDSFEKIFSQWIPEVKRHTELNQFVVVGLRSDLRSSSESDAFVPEKEARKTSIEAGAYSYVECSALKGVGLNEVLQAAAMSIEDPGLVQRSPTRCEIQ